MTYRGRVQNGVVVLEKPAGLPDGTPVSIRPLKARSERGRGKSPRRPAMYERYARFIGKAKGLPPDFSAQHDHYLYGTPKRP